MEVMNNCLIRQIMDKYGYNVNTNNIFRSNNMNNLDKVFIRFNGETGFIQNISNPCNDCTNKYNVSVTDLQFEVEHGAKLKLDNDDYNMQFNGKIEKYQLSKLLNLNEQFNTKLEDPIYECDSINNEIWMINKDNKYLRIRYMDNNGTPYYQLDQFNQYVWDYSMKHIYEQCGKFMTENEYLNYC